MKREQFFGQSNSSSSTSDSKMKEENHSHFQGLSSSSFHERYKFFVKKKKSQIILACHSRYNQGTILGAKLTVVIKKIIIELWK